MSEPGPIRVLLVDDSALMRKVLADMLRSEPSIEVVGTARDGAEAIELNARLRPDVVTLDVEMPGLSGLEALPGLLAARAVPVLMVSALTQEGADVTLAALELGAVDFLAKPAGNQLGPMRAARDALVAKVLAAAGCRVRPSRPSSRPSVPCPEPPTPAAGGAPGCVAIGISIGGPQALAQVFRELTPPVPPLLVVQHMPARFTQVFAERLCRNCGVSVAEAAEGDRVQPDRILIAPGGRHMQVVGPPGRARIALSDDPPVSGHRPSIDVLFHSAARTFGPATVGVIMTGMGRDGVEGCRQILAAGGTTWGQDEASSVVYGMNKAAQLEGVVRRQFALDELPALIARLARTPSGPTLS